MPTLILPTRYTPDSVSLWNAALSASWSAERLQSWKPPLWLKEREPVIYGEPLFAATVADALGLALLEAPLDWLTSVPATYLNRPVRYATLGDARQRTEPAFIKPADDKCFPAQVYASGAELAAVADLPDDIPVLVSQPVTWDVEYRCFVLERRVVTLSPYFRDGELVQTPDGDWPASPAEKEESLAFAAAVLADASVQIPPALVLDIGRIAEKGWSVVEANPAWSSGIYGCDPARVLPVLRRACVSEARLATEDMRWVLDRSGLPQAATGGEIAFLQSWERKTLTTRERNGRQSFVQSLVAEFAGFKLRRMAVPGAERERKLAPPVRESHGYGAAGMR